MWRFEVRETYSTVQLDYSAGRVRRLLTSRLSKRDTYPYNTKVNGKNTCLSPVLASSMIRLKVTVNAGQKPMEVVLIGPVKDMMHI